MTFIGQIVHVAWRGRCNAAVVASHWETPDIIGGLIIEPQNARFERRMEHGDKDTDLRWHHIAECPDNPAGSAGMLATEGGVTSPATPTRAVPTQPKTTTEGKIDGRSREAREARRLRGLSGEGVEEGSSPDGQEQGQETA